jgi:hypothetical protein
MKDRKQRSRPIGVARRRSLKLLLAALAIAACASACSKTSSTSADQTAAVASDHPATTTGAPSSDGSTAAAGGASNAAEDAMPPVYPGATKDTGESGPVSPGSTEMGEFYDTTADATAVAAWYDAHLPSTWTRTMGAPGKRTTGVFTSPDEKQIVSVTAGQPTTAIQFTLNAPSQ